MKHVSEKNANKICKKWGTGYTLLARFKAVGRYRTGTHIDSAAKLLSFRRKKKTGPYAGTGWPAEHREQFVKQLRRPLPPPPILPPSKQFPAGDSPLGKKNPVPPKKN
jgi:hypothetical protein